MKENIPITFIVTHNDVVLGESIPLIIEAGYKEQTYNINFTAELPVTIDDYSKIRIIVSTPILSKTFLSIS